MTQSHGNSLGRRVETMSDNAGEGALIIGMKSVAMRRC